MCECPPGFRGDTCGIGKIMTQLLHYSLILCVYFRIIYKHVHENLE